MKALGWITAYGVAVVVGALWSGYVLSVLWRWFIVSQFEGVPAISIPGAIGLALVVRYLTYNDKYNKDEGDQAERFFYTVVVSLAWPALALGFGYIVRGFL